MALGRLLLICLVASEVWDAETRPITFVCDKSARRAFNIVEELESDMSPISLLLCNAPAFHASPPSQSNCDGSSTLPASVQLPCVVLHVASWENKSQQEKRGDIVASLRLLAEGVNVVKAQSQPGCATSLLQKLEKNIKNYQLILGNLQLRGAEMTPTLSCVPQSTHSLSKVLQNYNKLISGKLECFMVDLKDMCTSQ